MRDGEATYYHYNGIGAVTGLTGPSADLIESYAYDAYGNILEANGLVANPYGFSTKEYNAKSGLIYFGARYYDPRIGRFITKDPLTWGPDDPRIVFNRINSAARNEARVGDILARGKLDPRNAHPFLYVQNNPINLVDPFGLRVSFIYRPMKGIMGAFGYHQAIKVNDRIVGFGPGGVHEEDSSLYDGRSHEVVIHPDDEFDDAYNKWLDNALQGNDSRFTPDNYWSNNWPWSEGESCYTFCDAAVKGAEKK